MDAFENISEKDSKKLLNQLKSYIFAHRKPIKNALTHLVEVKKKLAMHEFSSEVVCIAQPKKPCPLRLHVGFPFPIEPETLNLKNPFSKFGYTLDFFIRGKKLRRIQKKMIKESIHLTGRTVQYEIVKKKGQFRKITKKLLKGKKNILYVDPHNNPNETHLGNSLIGLHFLDSFQINFGFKNCAILSNSASHLKMFYKAFQKTPENFNQLTKEFDTILLPSVVDYRWKDVLKELIFFIQQKKVIFLIARNIIVDAQKNKIKIFSFRENDVLLLNKNIEDYMDDCLDAYVKKKKPSSLRAIPEPNKNTFFINPFSASILKDITPKMVLEIGKNIVYSSHNKPYIFISSGLKNIQKDWVWIVTFKKELKKNPQLKHSFCFSPYFSDLTDLTRFLQRKKVSAVLTPDTATSHQVTRCEIPNVTVFDTRFWDLESPQSVCTMFCRYYPWQMPAIIRSGEQNSKQLAKEISKALIFIQKLNQKKKVGIPATQFCEQVKLVEKKIKTDQFPASFVFTHKKIEKAYQNAVKEFDKAGLDWAAKIFNPSLLFEGFYGKKGYGPLEYCAWRISPIFKLSNQ